VGVSASRRSLTASGEKSADTCGPLVRHTLSVNARRRSIVELPACFVKDGVHNGRQFACRSGDVLPRFGGSMSVTRPMDELDAELSASSHWGRCCTPVVSLALEAKLSRNAIDEPVAGQRDRACDGGAGPPR
jgi:hypothetical protein